VLLLRLLLPVVLVVVLLLLLLVSWCNLVRLQGKAPPAEPGRACSKGGSREAGVCRLLSGGCRSRETGEVPAVGGVRGVERLAVSWRCMVDGGMQDVVCRLQHAGCCLSAAACTRVTGGV